MGFVGLFESSRLSNMPPNIMRHIVYYNRVYDNTYVLRRSPSRTPTLGVVWMVIRALASATSRLDKKLLATAYGSYSSRTGTCSSRSPDQEAQKWAWAPSPCPFLLDSESSLCPFLLESSLRRVYIEDPSLKESESFTMRRDWESNLLLKD